MIKRAYALLLMLLAVLAACGGEGTSANGALFITSMPAGADVFLNGEPRGRTPLTVRDLEPGEYEIVLRQDGYEDAQIISTVKSRQISNVSYTLRSERAPVTHRLAFISNRDGAFDLWTSDEHGGDATRWSAVRWTRAPLQVVLSPDGNNFALSVESAAGVATWLVSAPRPQAESLKADARTLGSDVFRVLQWGPDSRSILLKNLVSQTIWIGNLNGNITQVPIPDVPRGVLTAAFAPDGAAIAYVDSDKTWQVALDGTRRQELALNGQAGNTYLRYTRDGRRMAHVRMQRANIYNAGELWIMNANGSVPRRVSLVGSQDFDPVWSRDGQRIVFVHRENVQDELADQDASRLVSNLWLIDLQAQVLRSLTAFQGKRVRQPSLAPDDLTVTFISNQTGSDEIWAVDLRGGDPYPLRQDRASASFPIWLW